MQFSVFVNQIVRESNRTVVTATNGGLKGPPAVTFELPTGQADACRINKRYILTIEEDDTQ